MPNFKYNIQDLDSLNMYNYVNSTPLQDQAYYSGDRAQDYAYDYGFTDWFSDAKHAFYRSMQQGEMQESADIMASSSQNIQDATELLNWYDKLSSEDEEEVTSAEENIAVITDRMKKNGVINSDDVSVDKLNKIIKNNREDFNDAYKDYMHNKEQYDTDLGKHDISQYYNRRSNEAMLGTGKWYFSLPATMGTSMTSPALQALSVASGIAGQYVGGAIGSYFAPGAGTTTGAAVGKAAGKVLPFAAATIGALLFSAPFNAKARENESHMEAFNAYYEKVKELSANEGVDLSKIANNAREQLASQGEDITNYDDDMLIQRMLFDTNLKSGSSTFDRIVKESYEGTRRLYEKNNALGAGEMISDLTYAVPVGKFIKPIGKLASKPIDKLTKSLTDRFEHGVQLSKLGSKMRNKALFKEMSNFVAGQAIRSGIEASEEGAQHILSDRYSKGVYNNEYANDSFFDAITDGQLFSDIVDNTWLRAKAIGAAFDVDQEYKNDQQMMEEMFAGALLPFTSPQAMIGTTYNVVNAYEKIFNSKQVGDYIANALSNQDQINRNEQLFKMMRESVGGTKNHYQIMDDIRNELKRTDSSGKVRKYNLDSTTLTDDGSIPTDQNIDTFFDNQKQEYSKLIATKQASKKQLRELSLDPKDEDLFLALKYNAEQDLKQSQDLLKENNTNYDNQLKKISSSEEFRKYLQDKDVNVDELTDSQISGLESLIGINSNIDYIDSFINGVNKQISLLDILNKGKFTTAKHVVDSAKTLLKLEELRDRLNERKYILSQIIPITDKQGKIIDVNELSVNITDSQLKTEFDAATKNVVDNMILNDLLMDKYRDLNSTNREFIQQQVEKYRNTVRQQEIIADNANEAARNHTEPTIPEKLQPIQKVKDLTKEQLDKTEQDLQVSVNQNVEQFKSLIDSIPDDSYLSEIKQQINKYVGNEDDLSYARFVVGLMGRMKREYSEKLQSDSLSEDEKTKLKNLQDISDNFQIQLNDLLNIRAENKAKAERHPAKLSTNSSVWFDSDGNRYTFDMSKAEYSENEGLILHMYPVTEDTKDNDKDNIIKKLEDRKKKLQDKEYTEEQSEEQKLDKDTIDAIDRILSQLREDTNSTEEIIIKADDPLLQDLYTIRNDGTTVKFTNNIKSDIKSVNDSIIANKNSRKRKNYIESVEGDIYEFTTNSRNKRKGFTTLEQLAKTKKSGEVRQKAYSLNTPYGKAVESKLLNAYYQANYWYGKITMPYASVQHAEEYLTKDKAVVKKFGRTYDRFKSIALFHKIGGQIEYARNHNKYDEEHIFTPLKQLIEGTADSVKVMGAIIKKQDFDDMIFSLPLIAILYNPRLGKQRNTLFLPDFIVDSRDEKVDRNDAEFKSKAELIANLLISYKTTNKQDTVTEQDGMTSEENDNVVSNAVYISKGGVQIVNGDFNYNVYTEVNTESNTFTKENGEKMSKKEIDQYYKDHLTEAITNISKHLDELVSLLNEIGYTSVTKEKLLEEKDGQSNLVRFIEGTIKFGDGFIDLTKTYIPNYISPVLGEAEKTSSPSQARTIRARRILTFFQNKTPNSFLTYRNFQDENKLTPPVQNSVRDALDRRLFGGEKSIKVYFNNELLDTSNTPENIQELTNIMQKFEKLIRESSSSEEFLNALHDMGYSFSVGDQNTEENQKIANGIIVDYFNNRRFSRLRNPSNIVQAITLGTSTPLNKYTDFDNFNRQSRHKFGKLSDVDSLGLVKGENGQYYFSIEKFVDKSIKTKRDSDEEQPTEFEIQEQQLKLEYDKQIADLKDLNNKQDLVNWIIDHRQLFTDEQYDDLLRVNKKGEAVLRYTVKYTKPAIVEIYNNLFEEKAKEREQFYLDQIKKDVRANEEFAGLRTLPLMFAYGSYNSEQTGSQVIYFDASGNKHVMSNVSGTPGAMYLVVPAFLNSTGKRQIVHLNPKRFDNSMATAIASLLREVVVNGKDIDSFVNEIKTSNGFNFKSNATIKTVLDSLVFNGKAAILNDPNDNNYARLFNYDKQSNTLQFGDNIINADNFDQMFDALVQFIMENKTYRIDREKATNNNATFGIDLSISQNDNSLLDVKSDDNYISYVVDNGILLTDLNPNKGASIFSNPSVYMSYNKKYTFTTIPNDPNDEGSASNSRKKLKDELTQDEVASREDIEKEVFKSEKTDAVEYTQEFIKKFLVSIDQLYADKKIDGKSFKIGYYSLKQNKALSTADATFDFNPATGSMSIAIDNIESKNKLYAAFGNAYQKGYRIAISLHDSEGNLITVDGKPVMLQIDSSKKQSVSTKTSAPAQSNELTRLVDAFEAIAARISGQPTVVTSQPVIQQQQNQVQQQIMPSGYVSLVTPNQQTSQTESRQLQKSEQANLPKIEDNLQQETGKSFTITGNDAKLTSDGVTITLNLNTTDDALEDAIIEQYDSVAGDENGISDEMYDSFVDLFNKAKSSITNLEQPAQAQEKKKGGFYLNNSTFPGAVYTQEQQKSQPANQVAAKQDPIIPKWNQIKMFVNGNPDAKKLYDTIEKQIYEGQNGNQLLTNVGALFMKYIMANQPQFKNSYSQLSLLLLNDQYVKSVANNLAAKQDPNVGSIMSFLDSHVQKEDFDSALKRAETILGKNFDLDFLSNTPRVWDRNRQAQIYVFGQCAVSGIRLFRDANNQIAKGSLYHEAFHRISLFVLSDNERQRMYNNARESYPELIGKDNRYVEEFLADRFADFVGDNDQRRGGKYYSSNPVFKFFQIIFDKIRQIINKLTSANITPQYVNMNKLFQDMYSGRFAYAKATKNNIEEFEKAYGMFMPYAGFKVNGIEIANSAVQYNEIFRDLIGRFIRTSDLLTVKNGLVKVNMNEIKSQLSSELVTYTNALFQLDRQIRLNKKNPKLAALSDDMCVAAMQLTRLISTYNNILQDNTWKVWTDVITNAVEHNFNLEKEDSDNPNEAANEDTVVDENGEEIPQSQSLTNSFSKNRDSYMTDTFNAADISMKMLLWGITQYDLNKPETAKFTADGLMQYCDVKQLYRRVVDVVHTATDIEDMLNKLEIAAKREAETVGDYSMLQLFQILSDENNNKAIRNRFFTDFVRHIHEFENYDWEESSVSVPVGNTTVKEPRYNANIKSGSIEALNQNLGSRWKSNMVTKFATLEGELKELKNNKERTDLLNKKKARLNDALKKLKYNDEKSIQEVLKASDELFGFGLITNDIVRDSLIYKRIMEKQKNDKALRNVIATLLLIPSASYMRGDDNKKSNADKKLDDLFSEKGMLTNLSQLLSQYSPATPRSTSQRGPGNTKIYSIGSYNFITRLFSVRSKTEEWLNDMKLNPYSQHSLWLKEMMSGGETSRTSIGTKLSTMVDNNYQDSVADIDVTETEELLNRFVTTLSGYHQIPSLANKRFAANVHNLGMFTDVFDIFGNINSKVIDSFVGYLADEILAISDALYLRNKFISELNKIFPDRNFTVDSFSKMSALEQEQLFKNNKQAAKLLNMLVKQYHFTQGDPTIITKNGKDGDVFFKRAFHIDLRKGSGYKFRHFGKIVEQFKFTDDIINKLSENSMTDNSRTQDAKFAYSYANKYRQAISNMLRQNIGVTINKFLELGLITGDKMDIQKPKLPNVLTNRFLPANLISKGKIGTDEIYKAIGKFTIQGMSDMIEFEKLVSGDIGYHKNITSVNKRYSGIVSTIQITSDESTILNQLNDDRLYNNPIFRTVTLNTSKITNTTKFKGDIINALGIDAVTGFEVKDGDVVPVIDIDAFFDSNGNLYPQARNSPLISRYLDSRDNLRTAFYKNKKQLSKDEIAKLTDREVVEQAVENAITRFSGYLDNDPTDASVFITAEMFRQLKQREGKWNDIDEACYNLLENYDKITDLSKSASKNGVLKDICDTLGVSYDELLNQSKMYDTAVKNGDSYAIQRYKGYILGITSQLDATSLKYVYYGNNSGRPDHLIVPIYDKMSLSPIFKIFADGHQMSDVYNFMKQNQVDMLKLESAVKSGGVASFELFDDNGDIDTKALEASVVQEQYFNLIGKQLNTDPHHSTEASLLTQFMKIAMMNISDDETYVINGNKISGKQMKDLYKSVLDTLTERGYAKFRKQYGITDEGLDKEKFIRKIQEIVSEQGLPADTLAAFTTVNGEFMIHPTAIPSINFIQSRILSEVGKKIIETTTPGQPLYQVASMGYDNLFNLKKQSDPHLLMPGELKPDGTTNTRMQVKLSINFFADILKQAKEAEVKGYDFNNFEDQRRFILDNKELFALSYRVPTQGQNSTIPVEIVDLFSSQRGGIISFPAGITALTGSDFDIDKMFLARPNYEIVKGRIKKIQYDVNDIMNDANSASNEQLQNILLDMYQTVLTSNEHYLAANTPLDVCTAPLKNFTTNQIKTNDKNEGDYEKTVPGYYANPVFQTAQKVKNSGSDNGIGPMALNSVFRFFIQVSNLELLPNEYLKELGISELNKIYDRNGEDILDVTSALINAHVDAVKDNYIGKANVNGYTYDVTSFLTTSGFGNDTFAFLCQPILKQVAKNWQNFKNGHLAIPEDLKKGDTYLNIVFEDYANAYMEAGGTMAEVYETGYATIDQMNVDYLIRQIKTTEPTKEYYLQQIRYLNTFKLFKNLAQGYRDAITVAQIDTKKYGISANDVISFMQSLNQYTSQYNSTFINPDVIFNNTFLGEKYQKAIVELFDTFSNTILEFSPVYKNAIDTLAKQYGKYGRFSKNFLKRVGPKIKTVMFLPFFNQYLIENFKSMKPLFALTAGKDSVPVRFNRIKAKALSRNEGVALFDVLRYNSQEVSLTPQFMFVDNSIKDDEFIRSNVQAAMSELFNSDDAEIRQWANDFAVYMFYVTGGSDANAGGLIKTSVYDLIPPQHLANITIGEGQNQMTFNQYVTNMVMNGKSQLSEYELDHVMRLTALTDDTVIPIVSKKKGFMVMDVFGDNNVLAIGKGSNALITNGIEYIKFIKVPDSKGAMHTYQLGNVVVTEKGFINPVYFRIDDLGFRNQVRATLSVRADGYMASEIVNGQEINTIKSLLTNDLRFQARDLSQLDLNKSRLKFSKILSIDQMKDANNLYDMYSEGTKSNQRIYCIIDKADSVFVTGSKAMNDPIVSSYSEHRNKEYYILYEGMSDTPTTNGNTIAIIGTISSNMMSDIMKANPGKNIIYIDDYSTISESVDGQMVSTSNRDSGDTIVKMSSYDRDRAIVDSKSLYIFTDNLERTSGTNGNIKTGWYKEKYGKDISISYGTKGNTTTAVIRGIDNAAPITTMKYYKNIHKGMTIEGARFTDDDYNLFVKTIDEEIEQIKRMWDSGKYKRLVLPDRDGVISGGISEITEKRTPKLYAYATKKIDELLNYVQNSKSAKSNINGENISSRGSEFAKKLTNPKNNLSVEYKGVVFRNAEHAYQTWKSGEFDQTAYNSKADKPRGSKRVNTAVNFDIMVEILTAKLQQHPELIKGINERGGLDYIRNSTHNVIGDKYWETSGQNKFIEALLQAAKNVGITDNFENSNDVSNLAENGVKRIEECK